MVEDDLRRAILGKQVIAVRYKGLDRIVEPYVLFESQERRRLVHCWQVDGEWESTPPPDWCNMIVGEITYVEPTGRAFLVPHDGYNPRSPQFYRVLCCC